MELSSEELVRRRPVWEALSELFLDTELDELTYKYIARSIIASEYAPSEIESILWNEVFPAVEFNLRDPAGVWSGFELDWLEERILKLGNRQARWLHPGTAGMVTEAWNEVVRYLPEHFK